MKKIQSDKEFIKKIDNFWYYYKFHVLGGIFVLFCIGLFVRDMKNQVDYDYNIAFVGNYTVAKEDSENLQKWFEENGEDLNGDGSVHVQMLDYSLADDMNPQMYAASQTKFTVDIQESSSMIFILSRENYERFKEQGIFEDGEETVKMEDCMGFKEAGNPASVQNMEIIMRKVFENSKMSKNEEKMKYYDASRRLFEKFKGE